MVQIQEKFHQLVNLAIKDRYPDNLDNLPIIFQPTNEHHEGDITLMVFPMAKILKINPDEFALYLGEKLSHSEDIDQFQVIKGFLNLSLSIEAWRRLASEFHLISYKNQNPEKIVLEYIGPNTNKPLHIGHLRNVFLGYSVGEILKEAGHDVHKVNINNDRGIAICKSMIAYKLFGQGETPESTGLKGDHLIGKYYVLYNTIFQEQIESAIKAGKSKEDAEKDAEIAQQAQEMLIQYEDGNKDVISLWKEMNGWFYEGLHSTLDRLGIDFEKDYFESQEYKKGKAIVQLGYEKGVFQKDETNAIYLDLQSKGLDRKYLQRGNGTSIYITQDMALVKQRYEDFKMDRMIYTVGDEQNYHFKVLSYIMEALKEPFSSKIYHLSYGMVTSKDGSKFKSREGTTADADHIIDEVVEEAKHHTLDTEKGRLIEPEYLEKLVEILGIGAIKYAMLKVNPKKSIPYDPKDAVQLNGDTGTFIQYTFARTNKILQDYNQSVQLQNIDSIDIQKEERDLIAQIYKFPTCLEKAEKNYDPSEIAFFALQLAKSFNRFYHQHSILKAENDTIKSFRVYLTMNCHIYLKKSLSILGIGLPQKM